MMCCHQQYPVTFLENQKLYSINTPNVKSNQSKLLFELKALFCNFISVDVTFPSKGCVSGHLKLTKKTLILRKLENNLERELYTEARNIC